MNGAARPAVWAGDGFNGVGTIHFNVNTVKESSAGKRRLNRFIRLGCKSRWLRKMSDSYVALYSVFAAAYIRYLASRNSARLEFEIITIPSIFISGIRNICID